MIHVYSLVHDDLPAMDNDDLRRGRPTCHRQFDEATAILAGDALQVLAFESLAAAPAGAAARVAMISALAAGSGTRGMAGGQAIDLAAVGRELDAAEVEAMHLRKTGALIETSVRLPALLALAGEADLTRLGEFGRALGLAFQIVDDLLDVEGSAAEVGKATNKDAAAGKATFVSILGLERARAQAALLAQQAVAHLEPFGAPANLLRQAAKFVVERRA